jgi:hypothetical protein
MPQLVWVKYSMHERQSNGIFKRLERVDTAVMAKTALYSPELDRFLVAVPIWAKRGLGCYGPALYVFLARIPSEIPPKSMTIIRFPVIAENVCRFVEMPSHSAPLVRLFRLVKD